MFTILVVVGWGGEGVDESDGVLLIGVRVEVMVKRDVLVVRAVEKKSVLDTLWSRKVAEDVIKEPRNSAETGVGWKKGESSGCGSDFTADAR